MKYEDMKDFMSLGLKDNKSVLNYIHNKTTELLDIQKVNIKDFEKSYIHYQNILNIYADLVQKLNLKNSLQICMLFTYLLWNGYFSVNKKHVYTDYMTANIDGLASFDIMNGKGVCLSYSTMLRDFLIVCGYDSANLINSEDANIKYSYMPKIFRQTGRIKRITKFHEFISKIQTKNLGNHSFTLVNENDNLYIFDPTNLALIRITSINEAKVVNGKGTFKLMPDISYACNIPLESTKVLDKLCKNKTFDNPYTEEYYRKTFISLIADLNEKLDLLDIYYNRAFSDIDYVAKTALEEAKKR